VGNQAVASRVDKKLVPLRTKLASGQSVEIITAKSAAPKPQWLEFVVTSKARTAIRHQLKQLGHEDAVQLGHRMLDRALEDLDSSLDRLPGQRLEAFLVEHKYPRLEALLEDVALGNWMPAQAAQAMMAFAELRSGGHSKHSQEKILITGAERGVISFANCCQPIPGDEIMGFHTAGKGIVVHRQDCPNVVEFRKSPDRWVPIDWDSSVSGDYDASLLIEVENRTGALAQVAAAVAQSQSNIERVEYLERDINAAVMRFNIQVRDRSHLAEVMRRVRRLQSVLGVRRT
jgi:guanosine-3',5'-bis(diphosphate) 3'-pyrophosphohydrolase